MLRTGHVSQSSALHYARSDMERFKSKQFFALTAAGKVAEVADWVETCRKNAAKAAENLRSSEASGFASRRNACPTIEQEKERIEMLKLVEAQRNCLRLTFPSACHKTSVRGQREDPDRLYCKDITIIKVYDPSKRMFVEKKVPSAAVPLYVKDRIDLFELRHQLQIFYDRFPSATYKKVYF